MKLNGQQLPDPPPLFFRLVKLAGKTGGGLWLKASRYAIRDEPRYAVTRPHSSFVLYASDDLESIRAYLVEQA